MQLVKVGTAVLNQTPLDWDGNLKNILDAIEAARLNDVSILCLPELCISGYGCEDAFHSRAVQKKALLVLNEILPTTKGLIVCIGLPLLVQNALFNTACLVIDGRIGGFVAKRFLAGDGNYYEPRWFKPWPSEFQTTVSIDNIDYPIGDLYFNCGGVGIGFEICEDAWVAKRPGSDLALKGVDIILNPSASHFSFGKVEIRKRFVLEGSRAFGVTYLYSNHLGNESGRMIFDGGALIASAGTMLAEGPRFSFEQFQLSTAVIDLDATRTSQARTSSFRPKLADEADDRISFKFNFSKLSPQKPPEVQKSWENGANVKEEEFVRAVALGLFDYLRKSKSEGFVVSLSGGADSSAVSCLVAQMVNLALTEIGREKFIDLLPKRERFSNCKTGAEIVNKLLTCIYQATENSGRVTREAAKEVALGLGAQFIEWDLTEIMKSYLSVVSTSLKTKLTWEEHDIPLQNIQARIRAPGAWMVANLQNALLLVTSNRSEAAVGYATMDGDTAGSLSPLGGIDKAFLRNWLRWLEVEAPVGSLPVPQLKFVNDQQPTAELRPPGDKQTDEKDLMPYEVLDAIERAAIYSRQSPLEVFQRLHVELSHINAVVLRDWVIKFFNLWCRNQWKRERYAPSFHLDDENLDPKTWCRFPILSGGFKRELAELKAAIPDNFEG